MGCGMDKFKFVLFQHSRASNAKFDSWIWPNFKLVQDFMAVLFIWKFHNDLIKTKHIAWHKDKYVLFFFTFSGK